MMVGCVLCVLIAIAVAVLEVKLWTDTFCDFTIMIAFGYVIWGGIAAALVMTLVAMLGGITVLFIPKENQSNNLPELIGDKRLNLGINVRWQDMFLNLGINTMRKWEKDNHVPACFVLDEGRVSEIAVMLDSSGHRYLVYLTSRKPTFLPWTLVVAKQYGAPWQTQQQIGCKVFPFLMRPLLNRAYRIIMDWIQESGAELLAGDEAETEAKHFFEEMQKSMQGPPSQQPAPMTQ